MGIFRRNKDARDLKAMAQDRRVDEDDVPWFEGDDEHELDVETGVSFDAGTFDDRRRRR